MMSMEAGRSFQSMIVFAINDWMKERVLLEIRLTVRVLLRGDKILSVAANEEVFIVGQ